MKSVKKMSGWRIANYLWHGGLSAGVFGMYMWNLFFNTTVHYYTNGQLVLCICTALIMAAVPMIISGMLNEILVENER